MVGVVFGNPPGIGLRDLLREDFRSHDSLWTSPGFRVLAIHRLGNWRMGVEPKILRAPLSLVYRYMFRHVRNKYGIELEYCVRVGRRVMIHHQSGIVINGYCEIGDDCIIRQNVTMGIRSVRDKTGAPRLGNGVDVGAGAVILGDIRVGNGAQIGANAVVLTDVPAGAIAVGVPARIIVRSADSASTTEPDAESVVGQ